MADETLDSSETQIDDQEVEQPNGEKRRVAHWHTADRRANQQGPIQGRTQVYGRQKKEPCYEAVYYVRNPGGFKINEILYQGRVVVPACVADYLTTMDREWERTERNLFRNNGRTIDLGAVGR